MMGNTATPVDVEQVLADALDGVFAPPVPSDMEPPYSMVVSTGGVRRSRVIDTRYVDVDTWADSKGEAMAVALALVPKAEALAGSTVDGATVMSVGVTSLPYDNPDPDRPDLARATAGYEITTKAVISR